MVGAWPDADCLPAVPEGIYYWYRGTYCTFPPSTSRGGVYEQEMEYAGHWGGALSMLQVGCVTSWAVDAASCAGDPGGRVHDEGRAGDGNHQVGL
eukprot:1662162-Rhodomonas_salina.4